MPREPEQLHEFVVLAYEESPYLEACLHSLLGQTKRSRIIISTSTPNDMIDTLAQKYHLPVVVHAKNDSTTSGIAQDWNAALAAASARYVTLAHQDDVYAPTYTASILKAAREATRRGEKPLILFTDYYELRQEREDQDGKAPAAASAATGDRKDRVGRRILPHYHRTVSNRNLRIKRLLLAPMENPGIRNTQFGKRLCLCFGNAICCPSVTYVKDAIPSAPFCDNMGSNIDWQLWEKLSRQKGSFIYVPERLCCHRIHRRSTTTQLIEDQARAEEDFYMLRQFWPDGIARGIEHFYRKAEESNEI